MASDGQLFDPGGSRSPSSHPLPGRTFPRVRIPTSHVSTSSQDGGSQLLYPEWAACGLGEPFGESTSKGIPFSPVDGGDSPTNGGRMTPDAARFFAKVYVSGDCWLWTAHRNWKGYGIFSTSQNGIKHDVKAHRWIWEHLVSPIPEGYQVDHLCKVRHCVNPDHLEPVTPKENRRRQASPRLVTCKRGHEWTDSNTYWCYKRGILSRTCKTCKRLSPQERVA